MGLKVKCDFPGCAKETNALYMWEVSVSVKLDVEHAVTGHAKAYGCCLAHKEALIPRLATEALLGAKEEAKEMDLAGYSYS